MQTALATIALACGALALLRYVVGLPRFAVYLRRARVRAIPKGETPPISLIKPLYGADPGLAENLIGTLRQNYPAFEVLCVHERPDDPALAAVEAARAAVPDVDVKTIAGRDPDAVNPKVAVLIRGQEAARYDLIASADSDVRPDPLYLRDIANGLAEADVVSFVPILFGARTLWAHVAQLTFNTVGILGVILERGRAVTGSTIGVRRAALEGIGGYRAVASAIADDYFLGLALREAGCTFTLARRAARLYTPGGGFGATASWQVRWMRTIRSAAPLHFWIGLPMSAAPLLLLAAAIGGSAPAAWLLAVLTACRVLVAVAVDLRFVWDRSLVRALPLLPLAWVAEFALFLTAFGGSTVVWRGRRYRLKAGRASLIDA